MIKYLTAAIMCKVVLIGTHFCFINQIL